MHRVVIAATTLLALIGAVVVVAYLFIFGAAAVLFVLVIGFPWFVVRTARRIIRAQPKVEP